MISTSQREIKGRQLWIKMCEELGSVNKAAIKCGIPRSTLYRWIERYKVEGKEGLKGHSNGPNHFAKQLINDNLTQLT